MAFDFMIASGLLGILVNELISRDTDVTWDPNKYKYDSFRSDREKVENSVNSLCEGMSGEMIGNRF